MSKEAMKLALEALELNNDEWKSLADSGDCGWWRAEDQSHYKQTNEAITALREALAEQPAQQEPVEWMELLREARDNCKASIVEEGISASRKEYRIDLEARLTAALNTSPLAQRKPLTDELEALFTNIDHAISSGAWNVQTGSQTWELIQEAKAAHGIKENT